MILIKFLLLPFSFLYLLLTNFRNHLYNIGYYPSFHFDSKVISVGNLRVGGTGKTPHVEYLIRLLKDRYTIATLSRGYGRKTKGIFLADETATAEKIGDEPFQMYRKFSREITVAVGEERALAIPTILFEKEDVQVILLDDAYQHRSVKPDFSILLTEYSDPFYKDLPLPSGRLRESRYGARRAGAVIVTKCPEGTTKEERLNVATRIQKYSKESTPVFFTGIRYQDPQPFDKTLSSPMPAKVLIVTGIANPAPFHKQVAQKFQVEKVMDFKDHYSYDEKTIDRILKQFEEIKGNDKAIFTTEKDMVKWRTEALEKKLKGVPVFYLPIEVYFLEGQEEFDKKILDCVK